MIAGAGFDGAAKVGWNAVMQEGRASRTAERVAMRRAAHQLYDDAPLVFADPLALRVLPADTFAELRAREETERTQPFARRKQAVRHRVVNRRGAACGHPRKPRLKRRFNFVLARFQFRQ